MAKCKRCGNETGCRKICYTCMSKWMEMRSQAFEYSQQLHGRLCPENLTAIQKEMKRLDRIWRKDHNQFNREIFKNESKE